MLCQLISTIPLDIMLRWLGRDDWADQLTYSSSHIIGLGLRGEYYCYCYCCFCLLYECYIDCYCCYYLCR